MVLAATISSSPPTHARDFTMPKRPDSSARGSNPKVLGRSAFAAISAVEGLKLSAAGRKRISGSASADQRRADVLKAYSGLKGRK